MLGRNPIFALKLTLDNDARFKRIEKSPQNQITKRPNAQEKDLRVNDGIEPSFQH